MVLLSTAVAHRDLELLVVKSRRIRAALDPTGRSRSVAILGKLPQQRSVDQRDGQRSKLARFELEGRVALGADVVLERIRHKRSLVRLRSFVQGAFGVGWLQLRYLFDGGLLQSPKAELPNLLLRLLRGRLRGRLGLRVGRNRGADASAFVEAVEAEDVAARQLARIAQDFEAGEAL